jgi:hypothetical protein
MMDFEFNIHDTYYVGKDLNEAIKSWKYEAALWGR